MRRRSPGTEAGAQRTWELAMMIATFNRIHARAALEQGRTSRGESRKANQGGAKNGIWP
jgi:hypothetical protein